MFFGATCNSGAGRFFNVRGRQQVQIIWQDNLVVHIIVGNLNAKLFQSICVRWATNLIDVNGLTICISYNFPQKVKSMFGNKTKTLFSVLVFLSLLIYLTLIEMGGRDRHPPTPWPLIIIFYSIIKKITILC